MRNGDESARETQEERDNWGGERERSERGKEAESARAYTILYRWSLSLLPLKPTAAVVAFVVVAVVVVVVVVTAVIFFYHGCLIHIDSGRRVTSKLHSHIFNTQIHTVVDVLLFLFASFMHTRVSMCACIFLCVHG